MQVACIIAYKRYYKRYSRICRFVRARTKYSVKMDLLTWYFEVNMLNYNNCGIIKENFYIA